MISLWDKQAPARVVKTVSEPVKPATPSSAPKAATATKKKPAAKKG